MGRGDKSLLGGPGSELLLSEGGRKRKRSAEIIDETHEMSASEEGASQHTRLLATKKENMKKRKTISEKQLE